MPFEKLLVKCLTLESLNLHFEILTKINSNHISEVFFTKNDLFSELGPFITYILKTTATLLITYHTIQDL